MISSAAWLNDGYVERLYSKLTKLDLRMIVQKFPAARAILVESLSICGLAWYSHKMGERGACSLGEPGLQVTESDLDRVLPQD
jgi:hypothetical protein